MASTSSSTLTISSSTTLVDGNVSRKSASTTPKCVTLPTQIHSWNSTSFCGKFASNVMAKASSTTGEVTTEAVATTTEIVEPIELPGFVKTIQQAWDKVEDKYAISSLGVAAAVALWGSAGVISAIDRLPLVPGVLEVVGIGYTGWFAYKNIVFKSNREALVQKIKEAYSEIIGSSY
ncbi:hypothetical protein Lal_00036279 [Lupinus albus]|uniref:Putative photosystem I n=1 Tax=Lupinus albus TaxID=3870 RepID=A0A6A4P0A3_LUPAL|nr:putative photosystem I [Lupinus albus]KAF1891932.1 hypothetical protein Lal_00036279 [Lupinus albus]